MMINSRGSVRKHKKSTQKIPNSHAFSMDESEYKRINADESESKSVHVDVCCTKESKSKSVHKKNLNSHVFYM